jgi:hypothetical protein
MFRALTKPLDRERDHTFKGTEGGPILGLREF